MKNVIKHAFKTFPKLKLGQFSKLQDEAQATDYGLDEPVYNQIPIEENNPIPEENQDEDVEGIKIIENPEEPF